MKSPLHALVWICRFIWSVLSFWLGMVLLVLIVLFVAGAWIAFTT